MHVGEMRIFAVLVSAVAVVHCGPVSIISSYRSNAKADKDGNLFNSQHRKGTTEKTGHVFINVTNISFRLQRIRRQEPRAG